MVITWQPLWLGNEATEEVLENCNSLSRHLRLLTPISKCPTSEINNKLTINVYSMVEKTVLDSIANFPVHNNCMGSVFFLTHSNNIKA